MEANWAWQAPGHIISKEELQQLVDVNLIDQLNKIKNDINKLK